MKWALLALTLAGCTAPPIAVRVVIVEGCPGRDATIERIYAVADDLGLSVAVSSVLVDTPEGAVGARLLGSPTVLVNGVDIEPAARERRDFAIACRIYGTTPVPPRALIEAALRERSGTP